MIIPTGFAQVNIRFGGDAIRDRAEVTFGLDNTTSPKDPDILAALVDVAWEDNISPNWCDSATISTVLVKLGPNDTGAFAEVPGTAEGQSSNPPLSVNTAVMVRKITTHGGRQGRGRFYVPGYPESVPDGPGNLGSGPVASYTADFRGFLADLDAAGNPMVLLHGENVEASPYEVVDLIVSPILGTQRRRMRR